MNKKTQIKGLLNPVSVFLSSRPLILIWLLIFPAISPFMQTTLPRSADGLLHLYRVVALDHALHQGAIFPRWWPDLAYGYGQPLFVFYAPLAYYLTELLNLLSPDIIIAVNASFILTSFVAGTGMYLFMRDLFGPKVGLVAAVAYVYAPYQLFNGLSRGSLPIVWAAALYPWVFWAFDRLQQRGKPGDLALSAILCALTLLAHNISGLLFFPLLIFYLTINFLVRWDKPPATAGNAQRALRVPALRPRPLTPTFFALVLGIGLATFFWLPAMIEKEFVQIERVITPPDFDYHAHFVGLIDLFSLPTPANTGLLNPDFPLTLGLAQVGLAASGLLALLWRRLKQHSPTSTSLVTLIIFTLVSLTLAIFMMLPRSVGVWERLPLIAFVQHPHRLLGITAFLLAILAGVAIASVPARLQFSLTGVGIVVIFMSAIPLLYPLYYPTLPAPPTLAGMMSYERAIGAIGTTSFGEYVPIWVEQTPRESPLEVMYQNDTPIQRLDPAYLPAEAQIETAHYGFNEVEMIITTPRPYQALFHTFYFPGWTAMLDGQAVPVAPVSERGLLSVELPAGRHQLYLSFRETPIRLVANAISLLSLLLVIGLAIKSRKPGSASPLQPLPHATIPLRVSTPQYMLLFGLAGLLIVTKIFYFDRFDSPLKRVFAGQVSGGAVVPQRANFGHQLNLLGYHLERETVPAGQTFDLTAYWQVRQTLDTNYSSLGQLVDEQQHLYGGQDNLHPGHLPTMLWPPWGFVRDPHPIPIPPGTPPGDYFLVTGPYKPLTWERLLVVEGAQPGWNDVVAIPVTVTKPAVPPSIAALAIAWPLQIELVPEIRLLGATPEREIIVRADFLRVAIYWKTLITPNLNYQINLRLVNEVDEVVLAEVSQPSYNRYPTTRWTTGERVRDNHALWIPADFPTDFYRLQVRLLDEAGQPMSQWHNLGGVYPEP